MCGEARRPRLRLSPFLDQPAVLRAKSVCRVSSLAITWSVRCLARLRRGHGDGLDELFAGGIERRR